MEQFLSVRARPEGDSYERDQEIEQVLSSESTGVDTEQCLQEVASDVALALQADDLSYVVNELSSGSRWIPSEYDSRLLGMSRGALGRDLTQSERDSVRAAFREAVQNRVGTE